MPPSARCWPPATRAARSISTCRSARWCWTTHGRVAVGRAAAAPGQPPADRGVHGAGQCRRRRGAGAAAPALHVPRARAAVGREAGGAARLPAHASTSRLPPGNQLHPRDLDRVLQQVAGTEQAPLVNEVMLRSQSQAAYSPDNIGHFGLALARYAHFTSPIRRYADLLVHRALIARPAAGRRAGWPRPRRPRLADIGRAHHRHRTPRRAGRARRDRPLPRCLHGGQGGRGVRRAHFRRDPVRSFRHSRGQRRERTRAGVFPAGRFLVARRSDPDPVRPPHAPHLPPGAGGRGAAGRGEPGDRRPGVPYPAGRPARRAAPDRGTGRGRSRRR